MNISIRFTTQTVKMLIGRLQHAYRVGDLRLVRRVSALLDLSRGTTVAQVAEIYSVSRQAVYDWLKALMCRGESSLIYRRPARRKSRLTKTQKQQLRALVEAGPQAAGFMTACWNSVLIQQLIHREFGVLYNRYYVCQLLRNLGFSVQKCTGQQDAAPFFLTAKAPRTPIFIRILRVLCVFAVKNFCEHLCTMLLTSTERGTFPITECIA